MYSTLLGPGDEADLDALTTSCISDQLSTIELNSINRVDNKRVIVELNSSPWITVCIPLECFEFCIFQLTAPRIS